MVAGQQDRGALTRRLVQNSWGLRRSAVTKDCILMQIHQIADCGRTCQNSGLDCEVILQMMELICHNSTCFKNEKREY